MTAGKEPCVLIALAPVYRGLGYVVLDNDSVLLDWGVKEARREKLATCLDRARALFALHRPRILVLELTGGPGCRRRQRIRDLIAQLGAVAGEHGIHVASYDRADVFASLSLSPNKSKDALAAAVAARLPMLARQLPAPRRLWESEKHSMAVFEAAGLALRHLSQLQAADGPS